MGGKTDTKKLCKKAREYCERCALENSKGAQMTEQEAIKWLECIVYEQAPKTQRAMLVGIKALEKQIAKKVISEHKYSEAFDEYGVAFKCPCCKEYLIVTNNKYCWDCGQKLDWGNEDAE